ncbi:ketopantoate reductase family protein [Cellulosilyticum ruminicola]|uniref:ketopantoate reductase family protein n=1 Tax=Cellulosilyticum ruminicola TaxID=425254 RepID=UPI000B124D7A|nr:2-dehydropantoate 2-reductase [Cellulosilyticum ruminicola]
MNIAFIGIGGVGGYFGGKLSQVTDKETRKLYFIARGNHLKAIQEKGLLLKTNKEGDFKCAPYLATDHIDELPMLDLCFICVKGYDLANVLVQLKNKVNENTIIIPLLNGVDIYSRIRNVIQTGTVFPACVYVGTHIKEPGVVEQNGGACTIILDQIQKILK